MARVFTTNFHYKGSEYTAMVSQIDGSITITFLDPTIKSELPDGKVVYRLIDGIEINPDGLTPAQDLILAVLAAIEQKGFHVKQGRTPQNRQEI